MKKILAVLALAVGLAASASAQVRDFVAPDGSYTIIQDSQGRSIMGMGVRPAANPNLGISVGMPFYDAPTQRWWYYTGTAWSVTSLSLNGLALDTTQAVWGVANGLRFEGTTVDGFETLLSAFNPTAGRTIILPDDSGNVILDSRFSYGLTADAVVQYGQTVMPDAATASRFDVNGANGTGAIGVLGPTGTSLLSYGPSVAGTSSHIIFGGYAYVAIAEDQDVALGEYLTQSATAGYCNAAAIATIGLNIGRTLTTAPVTNTINPAGCTGAAGCINTALDTPNAGPAGQITLAADVAAAGWAVGDAVTFWNSGGATPTGLTDGATYWLLSVSTTNVTIAATKGGAVVVPSDQGNDATQYLQKLPRAIVHVY